MPALVLHLSYFPTYLEVEDCREPESTTTKDLISVDAGGKIADGALIQYSYTSERPARKRDSINNQAKKVARVKRIWKLLD